MENEKIILRRLDTIDKNLEKLTDALISIARTEEKVIGLIKDYDILSEALTGLRDEIKEVQRSFNKRLVKVESSTGKSHSFVNTIERAAWVIFTALCSWAAATFKGE